MKKRRIGIDARLYFQTGVGTYLRNLLYFLQQNTFDFEFYVYVLPDEEKMVSITDKRFLLRPVDARWHSLSEQTTFNRILLEDELDLMHFTYFSYPIFYKKPFIATIHDLTPLLFKTGRASALNPIMYEFKYQVYKRVLLSQIQNSLHIITPTETVKNQIVHLFGNEYDQKITPIYEGVNIELIEANDRKDHKDFKGTTWESEIDRNVSFEKDYFLYVGNFYPHKNVTRLIDAFGSVKTDKHLILVGPANYFSAKLKKEIKKAEIKNIRFYHNTSDKDLVFFYTHAKALVNPSLSEGFGLPLVEATYFGCPVIASDIPVFRELLGDRYASFDPKDTSNIAKILKNEDFNKSEFNSKFSFEKMSKETLKLYTKTIESIDTSHK